MRPITVLSQPNMCLTPRAMYCRFRGCDTLSLPRGLHITVVRQGQIWPRHTFSHATSPSVHRSTATSPHRTATFNSHLRHCVLGFGHFDLIPLNLSSAYKSTQQSHPSYLSQ
ncbi:hypothetical protein CROQUDRAFT_100036 [Cronartium quercuum f. sp. fusiforme G11]|uniref:Uncharacterized protein n=1 Tax=Cronartium quercuum f. sp. fusiforme G11 TaxID=708437 RepID=A0A9P6T613_9BASI|nr:hypothetical protein CROQUDRAFT_100036 [Cronartium quercuum f. sp. fusiforme G11]